MSLGTILDIAKTAMAVNQYEMNVRSHNIANAYTDGYSKQELTRSSKGAQLIGGLSLGRGVEASRVTQTVDRFVEAKLTNERSDLSAYAEMQKYMQVLESYFNENNEASMGSMIGEYWNLWHDIANNPSGSPERTSLVEHSLALAEKFTETSAILVDAKTNMTQSVSESLGGINQITAQIAQLNSRIISTEVGFEANDLRDGRNRLINQLSEYIDVKTIEKDSGALTVISAKGSILVEGTGNFELSMGGDNGNRVIWEGSGGNTMDITDFISSGKLGGWLDMRDEVFSKYQLDFDSVAEKLIWEVNRQHSQGVGLKLFEPNTSLTGAYTTDTNLGGLHFGDEIEFKSEAFHLWIEDRGDSANPVMSDVSVDLSGLNGTSTLSELAMAINAQISAAGLSGVTASVSDAALRFDCDADTAVGFSQDESNLLASLGMNTFFVGTGAGSIGINTTVASGEYICAGAIDSDGGYAVGDNTNALAVTDIQFSSNTISQWTCDRIDGNVEGAVTTTIEDFYNGMLSGIGITADQIDGKVSFGEAMVNNIQSMRDQYSAVDLNEEMAQLVKLNQAFTMAARLMETANKMMDDLFSIKQ